MRRRKTREATVAICACFLGMGCESYDVAPDDSGLYAACCDGAGICVPSALVSPSNAARLPADSCEDALVCAPIDAVSATTYVPRSCRSIADREGRCLPSCLPDLADDRELLPTKGCPPKHVCAPCFDPRTGDESGACSLGDDPGPAEQVRELASCCDGVGSCVPASLLDEPQRMRLDPNSCSEAGALCVPSVWVRAASIVPESCRSIGDVEGRCLPPCLPELAAQAERLPRGACAEPFVCAPCFDPLTRAPTGACSIGDDPGPEEDPASFASCCAGGGRCIPDALLPDAPLDQLDREGCAGSAVCVPEAWTGEQLPEPVPCRDLAGAEGRCLPVCLPAVMEQAEQLLPADCADGELCTPCFDPRDGRDTGACHIGSDSGPLDAPVTFGTCCEGEGRCLPRGLVPPAADGRLEPDQCAPDSDTLCVPAVWLGPGGMGLAPSCRSWNDAEGRCLPRCLPEVSARAERLRQDSCVDAQLCVPCFEPLSGAATGACTLGDDPGPKEPPTTFDACCLAEGVALGLCIPESILSAEQRELLPADVCDSDSLCVPERLARSADARLASCEVAGLFTTMPGACVPACLIEQTERALLGQQTCAAGELCAPCSALGASGFACGD